MAAIVSNIVSPLAATLNVAIGGAIGAVLRYQIGRGLTAWLGAPSLGMFPWATLTVNVIGSLLMGVLAGWLARHGSAADFPADQLRLLLGVGLLGGFTTFSAFSLELVLLIDRGQYLFAFIYIMLSLAMGISGLLVGIVIARSFS